jgi:hypothetical protein
MALSFLYQAFWGVFQLVPLMHRADSDPAVEVVMLRHEVALLRRQVQRPALQPAERALLAGSERAVDLQRLLARGRLLLLQGVASTFADRLSAALLARAGDISEGEGLRAAIDRIRVGVVSDSAGTLHQRAVQ